MIFDMDYDKIAYVVFALVVMGLLIYIAYQVTNMGFIHQVQKTQSIQLTVQSVAIGTIAEYIGCGDQLAARFNQLVQDTDSMERLKDCTED